MWSPVTLRFRSYDMEAAFALQRKAAVLQNSSTLVAVAVLIYFIGVVLAFAMEKQVRSTFPTDAAYESSLIELYTDCAMLITLLVSLAALRCRWLTQRLSSVTVEVSMTILMIAVVTTLAMSSHMTMTKILGYEPAEAYGENWYSSDSGLVLKIDSVVTAAHSGLPVRWHILLPLEVVAILLYTIHVFVIGSDEPMENASYNLLLLSSLVVAAALGKRAAERGERNAFLNMIDLKSAKCQAEYQLAQATDARAAVGRQDSTSISEHMKKKPSSDVFSVPTTAVSMPISAATDKTFDPVFNPMYEEGMDVVTQFRGMATLGKSEHWCIDGAEVKIVPDDSLDQGSFGLAAKGIFCGMPVAVKRPQLPPLDSATLFPDLCNEFRTLQQLRHPNICITHGAILDEQTLEIALVMELLEGGFLLDRFMRQGAPVPPSPFARYQIMLGVCRALVYMHACQPPIVHSDLKSSNIAVEVSGAGVRPKLLECGLSRLVARKARPSDPTLAWSAPEVVKGGMRVQRSADIYSFGRVVAFTATGIPPLSELSSRQMKRVERTNRPPLPTWPRNCDFTPACKQLVQSCLRADEARRPSIFEVHEQLLVVPRQLDLDGAPKDFAESLELVERHMKDPENTSTRWFMDVHCQAGGPPPLGTSKRIGIPGSLASVPEAPHEPTMDESEQSQLILPDYTPTEAKAMALSLVELTTRWNFPVLEAPCCRLHAGVRAAERLCSILRTKACNQMDLELGKQCPFCGVLGLDEEMDQCDICQRSFTTQEAPSQSSGCNDD
mmetsp:Transcript_93467/g.273664  ORF Transcript_93467/g.273664 Transcript_93467/m.273664 type:complete len:781 (-) Transcript_93467:41-2383(-)